MTAVCEQFRLGVLFRNVKQERLSSKTLHLALTKINKILMSTFRMMDHGGGPCEKPAHEDLWGQRNHNGPQSAWFQAHAEIEGSGM